MTAHRTARITGAAYLGIVICGLFAELVVRGSLVFADDAGATATAIAGAPGLFGLGVGADLLMITLDVGVAYGLYRLLRPVHARLALAAAGLRLAQAAVLIANLYNPVRAFVLARSPDASLAAGALDAMQAHALFYDVGLIFFGLACLVLGRLFWLAEAPRWLAVGLALTGGVYLVGSFAAVFAPSVQAAIDPLYVIAIVVEPAVAIWLMVTRRFGAPLRDEGGVMEAEPGIA